ncbi:MAG: Na/Pi cotransporter family protein [Candidatus Wallbacteria bacterium]|nr:Na/Pi cotransporter family protein [Candidatus Wallbacteria bacterium]
MIKSSVLLLILILLSGCQKVPLEPGSLKTTRGNGQCLKPGQTSQPLEVTLYTAKIPGLFGGEGEERTMAGREVKFQLLTEGQNYLVSPACREVSVATDEGGSASVLLTVANHIGDLVVKASVIGKDGDELFCIFQLQSGVIRIGNKQEGDSGSVLDRETGVQVFRPDGAPWEGVPVDFELIQPRSGKICPAKAVTDSDGRALTTFTLGKETGEYILMAQPAFPDMSFRSVKLTALALNRRTMVMTVLGGLALFILGMKMMTEGLSRIAGNRMKKILELLTTNRIMGVMVGATVTAVIQSSSACTVMVVGFVNAGLMQLSQAMAVIMGANIGTTMTGQIVAFRIGDAAFPAIIIGLLMSMFWRGKKPGFLGELILGFGLLFLGMGMMTDTLKPLGISENFKHFFALFDCTPVNGVMPLGKVLGAVGVGTLFTAVVQSSSATIGLAMAMAGAGLLNFWTAFPLILGDNIGTTITALLAAIASNRRAKQAALFHSVFNIFGSLVMIGLLYVRFAGTPVFIAFVDWFTPGSVLADTPVNIERHIAMAHSFFNVSMAVMFLPLLGPLKMLIESLIKVDTREKIYLRYLEPHLLNTPALAFDQSVRELAYMLKVACKNVFRAYNEFIGIVADKDDKLIHKEEVVDRLQLEITDYLVQLSQRQLDEEESARLPALIHCVNDAERIGDHADSIRRFFEEKKEQGVLFGDEAKKDLHLLKELVEKQYLTVLKALEERDDESIKRALHIEEEINILSRRASQDHAQRVGNGCCEMRGGVLFSKMISNFERIGDHLSNIAERIPKIRSDSV